MNESETKLLLEDLPELTILNFENFEEESQRLLADYLAELRINRISLYTNGSNTEIFTKMSKGFGLNRSLQALWISINHSQIIICRCST